MFIPHANLLAVRRTNDLSEPLDLYLQIANELTESKLAANKTRAEFIRMQCEGAESENLFNRNREAWEIPNFDEDLITADDFKRGFLWCFRDHTPSWRQNQEAKQWFLNSSEATFVRCYELWMCDNGYDECIEIREGSYKEILISLLNDADYEVLTSPAFTNTELQHFIDNYDVEEGDFSIEEIIEEYISKNPNYED